MKRILFILVLILSKNALANCTAEETSFIKKVYRDKVKLISLDNECRYSVNWGSEETTFIKARDGMQGQAIADGPQISWYSNGQKKSELNNVLGKINGLSKRWYSNGNIQSESYYKDNVMHGEEIIWKETGEIISKIKYINGIPSSKKSVAVSKSSLLNQDEIKDAKDKCKALGFKTGTEKFGACVLELTR